MLVCISTGGCIKLGLGPLKAIHYFEKFSGLFDGIEICLATPKELSSFELDARSKKFLQSLSYNSIHLPFLGSKYSDDKSTKHMLGKASKITEQVNAYNLVLHPANVKSYALIERSGLPISLENLNQKPCHKGFQTPRDLAQLLERFPGFGFTLDLAHALSNNIMPDKFLDLSSRLFAIHVVSLWQNGEKMEEGGFWLEASNSQKQQSKRVLRAKVPLVIEAHFFPQKAGLIDKEIRLLQNISKTK